MPTLTKINKHTRSKRKKKCFSFRKAEMQLGNLLGSGKGAGQPPNALAAASRGRSCFTAKAPLDGTQRCLAHYWYHHTNKEESVVADTYTDLD